MPGGGFKAGPAPADCLKPSVNSASERVPVPVLKPPEKTANHIPM